MPATLKIKLKKVKIVKNGYFEKEEGFNTMETSLLYPLPGTPAVKSVRPLKLKENSELVYAKNNLAELEKLKTIQNLEELKNELKKYTNEKRIKGYGKSLEKLKELPDELIKEEEFDALSLPIKEILFMQKIEDETYLEVQISAVRKVNQFEKLIFNILTAGAKAVVKGISGIGAGVTAMTTSSTESIIDLFSPEDKSLMIAYGMRALKEDVPNGEFRVDLFVPETKDIKSPKEYDDYGRIVKFDKKGFKKGEENGYAIFEIERI